MVRYFPWRDMAVICVNQLNAGFIWLNLTPLTEQVCCSLDSIAMWAKRNSKLMLYLHIYYIYCEQGLSSFDFLFHSSSFLITILLCLPGQQCLIQAWWVEEHFMRSWSHCSVQPFVFFCFSRNTSVLCRAHWQNCLCWRRTRIKSNGNPVVTILV